jgi:hypothetical protein
VARTFGGQRLQQGKLVFVVVDGLRADCAPARAVLSLVLTGPF